VKIRPVGDELFHKDRRTDGRMEGQTDMTKLIVTFRNFSNAPESGWSRAFAFRDGISI